jgi:hypothetical protein
MPDVRQVTRRYAVSARFCSFLLIQLLLYGLLSSCAHLVTISYPPAAVIHPAFNKQPCIDRVVFLAVPHRGSRLAAGILGSIGNRLIRRPKASAVAIRELTTSCPGILRPYYSRPSIRGGPTSLISLAPNPLLDRLAALPIRVPFHSIMGDRGLDGGMHSSDGVVPYSSSHLAGAESEKIVPAGHLVFSNEGAVLEIKRILQENLMQQKARIEVRSGW